MKKFIYEINNTEIILGENNIENWKIISQYKVINSNYIWLHLNSFPSGHVIILSENIDNELLHFASTICKDHTKYKNIPKLKICYTPLSNILKSDKIGEVEFKSQKLLKTFNL